MEAKILRCPFCGNTAPQLLQFQVSSKEEVNLTSTPEDSFFIDVFYFVTKCPVCDSVLMYNSVDNSKFDSLNESMLCYPVQPRIGVEVPEKIAKNYIEAKKVKTVSPTAYSVLIRRGLEFICEDQKTKGHSLKQKLNELASRGVIPKTLAEMSETLRFLGNIGAHATDFNIDWDEVYIMDEFYLSMIEYIYIAPAKIARLRASINKKLKKPSDQD